MNALSIPLREEAGDDMEQQARSVLRLILDSLAEDLSPLDQNSTECPNCGSPFASTRTPYCSHICKAQSAFVRQFRSALKTGTISEPERQVGLGQNLWYLLGGGRPLRLHLAPPSSIKQVMKRTDSTCELCGAPATTVDHTGSG